MELSLTRTDVEGGVESIAGFAGSPDAQGVLLRRAIALPEFECCTYYAAFQKYDCIDPNLSHGHNGANRIQPLKIDHFNHLKPWGVFLLARLTGGDVLAVLPVCGPATAAWFEGHDGRLTLTAGTGGTEAVECDLPLLAWARSRDAYEACRLVWRTAMDSPFVAGATRPRCEKSYPEPFRYLGWCSWEQFRKDINEQVLTDCIGRIEAGDAPVRYVLVDDGHFDLVAPDDNRLMSFVPDPGKFPHGWGPVIDAAGPKVRWMGLWLNFNGYWKGIHPDNRLGAVNDFLMPVSDQALEPRNDTASSLAFYDAMVSAARRAGFAFVKVDHQAAGFEQYRGTANAAAAAARNAQSLEAACAHHMDGLINCMAHGPVCPFNTRCSAVTRCSEDYRMGDLARARRHLHNSYANIPWMGQTVWGDHDMFHSSDPVAGRMMAVSKALSGGPVYLSDRP
ncbi:MAG TPA: Sip1-related alpha-galactosidase, partial [Phycisphaerae bacterium]|nr:Sip1-related alpha-galactosidase [Phycisphaerae bacterium]